jgi:hypothetical protein
MYGHPSGHTIWAEFCSDTPSAMSWIFDQKCSDYIRQKAKNFSKSVRTIIWVRHLYSGVLVDGRKMYGRTLIGVTGSATRTSHSKKKFKVSEATSIQLDPADPHASGLGASGLYVTRVTTWHNATTEGRQSFCN